MLMPLENAYRSHVQQQRHSMRVAREYLCACESTLFKTVHLEVSGLGGSLITTLLFVFDSQVAAVAIHEGRAQKSSAKVCSL